MRFDGVSIQDESKWGSLTFEIGDGFMVVNENQEMSA